jgi:DtxR family Mn-dependent transcriptional regulator
MRKKKLSSNMEDYLEAILVLKNKNGTARVTDIAQLLFVKKPSVNAALKKLLGKKLIIHSEYSDVQLTKEGEGLACDIQRRHTAFVKFLSNILNIDAKVAAEDACRMEHVISPQTFKKLTKFIEFVETCPGHDRPGWLQSFDHYFKTGKRPKCKIKALKQKVMA